MYQIVYVRKKAVSLQNIVQPARRELYYFDKTTVIMECSILHKDDGDSAHGDGGWLCLLRCSRCMQHKKAAIYTNFQYLHFAQKMY